MGLLNRAELIRILYRSLFLQATWNYQRMMALGYAFCLAPFVLKLLPQKKEQAALLQENLGFFNTQPYMAGWLIGATMHAYERWARYGQPSWNEIARLKKHMSQSLAAIGDKVFWGQLKPIAAMVGVVVGLYSKAAGVLLFLLIYNVPHIYVRVKGLLTGYKKGVDVITEMTMNNFGNIIRKLNFVAAILTGILLAAGSRLFVSLPEIGVFVAAMLFMYLLLKLRISVPAALITIMMLAVLFTGILKLI